MKKFSAKRGVIQAAATGAKDIILGKEDADYYGAYIGLDVHKDTLAVAIAEPGRSQARAYGEIANTRKALAKLLGKLIEQYHGQPLLFCYEAGPCGYGVYRYLIENGFDCQVVAPSLIPHKPGERIKTDRRDACKLATHLRNGDLTAVWVPDKEQEAMRDLTRARGDMKLQEQKARQQLNAFVLRHGHHWPSEKSRWTKAHFNWLESLKFEQVFLQLVLQEYIDAVKAATARVNTMTAQMENAVSQWSLGPIVNALVALRGIDKVAAIVLLAELGDISRFDSPKQLMAFLGLVPSEHSSGGRRRQGAITLTGNRHARRMLVECAWSYRFAARQTAHLKRKAAHASEQARAIAWQAQKRLCGRYRHLIQAGKNTKVICVAIARELVGFVWNIVRHEMGLNKQHQAG